jgi:hypothetical protein
VARGSFVKWSLNSRSFGASRLGLGIQFQRISDVIKNDKHDTQIVVLSRQLLLKEAHGSNTLVELTVSNVFSNIHKY